MFDKEKAKAKREKEMQESINVWQDLLGSPDNENKKEEPNKDNKEKKK